MAFWSDPSELLPKQAHRWVILFGDQQESINHFLFKSIDRPSYEIGSVQAKYLYSHTFNFPKRVTWKPIKVEFYDAFVNTLEEKISIPKSSTVGLMENSSLSNLHYKSTQSLMYLILKKSGYFDPNETADVPNNLMSFKGYTFKNNLSLALLGSEVKLLRREQAIDSGLVQLDAFDFTTSIFLRELDDEGNILEEWELYNPFITNVNFNKLDYSSDNVLTITADIVYDWAQLNPRKIQDAKLYGGPSTSAPPKEQTENQKPPEVEQPPQTQASKTGASVQGDPFGISSPPSRGNVGGEPPGLNPPLTPDAGSQRGDEFSLSRTL